MKKTVFFFLFLAIVSVSAGSKKLSRTYLEKGKYYYIQGHLDKAVLYFKKSLAQNPDNADAKSILLKIYLEKGRSYFQHSQFNKALSYFQNAAELSEDNGSINEYIQQCEEKLDNHLNSVKTSKILNVKKSQSYYQLGTSQYLDGNYTKAAAAFRKSLYYNYKNEEAKRGLLKIYLRKGRIYFSKQKYTLALKYLKLARKLSNDPASIDALIEQCRAALKK